MNEILNALSRRNFLRTSSTALATTLLAQAAMLRAQERPNTEAAEHDHSVSDPGQQNKALLDLNPDSNLPPTDHGDMVSLWYSFDLVKKRVQQGGIRALAKKTPPQNDWLGLNETIGEVIALAQGEIKRQVYFVIALSMRAASCAQSISFLTWLNRSIPAGPESSSTRCGQEV